MVTAVMVVVAVGLLSSPAVAAPWGACGVSTDESKVVAQYPVNRRITLTQSERDLVAEVLRSLRGQGLIAEPAGSVDDYVVRSKEADTFGHRPVLSMPTALLSEYLEQMSRDVHDAVDPLDEALSLTVVHLQEELETDHHEGRNYVRALGFRRGRGGRVEMFVDQDPPELPARQPDPDLRWEARRPSDG